MSQSSQYIHKVSHCSRFHAKGSAQHNRNTEKFFTPAQRALAPCANVGAKTSNLITTLPNVHNVICVSQSEFSLQERGSVFCVTAERICFDSSIKTNFQKGSATTEQR